MARFTHERPSFYLYGNCVVRIGEVLIPKEVQPPTAGVVELVFTGRLGEPFGPDLG
tara:strand:+ start:692 stop:859 length:168 start_codon:yes stop_codon:yes gene_type:complete